ncbi:MAG: transposase [Thermodesulfobacteriota bacterium]|nr:transposase [Thermodesulfobacteriota bacterium]
MDIIKSASETIFKRLVWHTAKRDQAGIAEELVNEDKVHEIYGLGDAGLFDEFFCFLRELGIMKALEQLAPRRHRKRESSVSFPTVMLIYLMRIVAGLKFFYHTGPVLLQSQSLMHLAGFNGREIKEGVNRRSLDKSKTDWEDKNNTGIRGPVCPEFIASFIVAIADKTLERVFNKVISILAAHSFFPRKIKVLLDASDLESSEKCKGRGKVTKEKAPELRRRRGRVKKISVTVFGFKIWVVWDPTSRLPIAMRFATIETSDITLAREVIGQAITNLGEYAKIVSIAMDRGFMDGKLLWWLNSKGIIFYIPAKSNQNVYNDALSLMETGQRVTRERNKTTGHGKNSKQVTDTWDVVGIEGLTTAGFYGELGSGSHENRIDFRPNLINAVVVLYDPYRENNPDIKTMVILTNGPVGKPLKVYDGYDARSEIENSLFRESKQGWFIKRPPENSKAGFLVHAYLTIMTMALTRAFRDWMIQQEELEEIGEDTGIRKFRQKVRQENSNKCIVFHGERYAIFYLYELLILCGKTVLKPRGVADTITREDILRKYGALLE